MLPNIFYIIISLTDQSNVPNKSYWLESVYQFFLSIHTHIIHGFRLSPISKRKNRKHAFYRDIRTDGIQRPKQSVVCVFSSLNKTQNKTKNATAPTSSIGAHREDSIIYQLFEHFCSMSKIKYIPIYIRVYRVFLKTESRNFTKRVFRKRFFFFELVFFLNDFMSKK